MRLFIAIPLSRTLRSAVVNLQNDLYAAGVRGSYSPEENLHLTLAFIGEYPSAAPVLDAVADVAFAPFDLGLDGIGAFDDTWWVGVRHSAALQAVVKRIRRALAENGIPFDKKAFRPHVTLLRRADAAALPAGLSVPPMAMTVDHICLYRSDRGKRGMIYTEVGRIERR